MTSTPKGRICFAIIDDQCGFYRTFLPASELAKRGFRVSVIKNPDFQTLRSFDTVIFEAPFSGHHLELIRRLKGEVHCVLDLDDNYHQLEPSNPRYAVLTSVREIITAVIQAVDEVIVSTEALREFYLSFNSRITVLPNMMPTDIFVGQRGRQRSGPLRIGWHGGLSHDADLRMLEGVLPTIHKDFPEIRFVFFGNAPRLKVSNAEYVAAVPYAAFPATLAHLRLDIGMAPLTDAPFNRYKTNLKWMEFSALRIPTVASDVLPYRQSIQHGVNGLLAATAEDWVRELGRLIRDVELRKTLGDRAYESVKEHYNCEAIGAAYSEAAARWPARTPSDSRSANDHGASSLGGSVIFGIDIFAAALLCMLGAMIPWLLILPIISPASVPRMVSILCAIGAPQAFSIITLYIAAQRCLGMQRAGDAARTMTPSPDPEQGLIDFFNYHRAAANFSQFGRKFIAPAAILTVIGLVPLALVRPEDHPRILVLLFCACLPEAAILTLAFTWTYYLISRRLPTPEVLPLEGFILRLEHRDERLLS